MTIGGTTAQNLSRTIVIGKTTAQKVPKSLAFHLSPRGRGIFRDKGMKKTLLTSIAVLFLAMGTAHAANITGGRYGDGSIMYIDIIGDIEPGDDAKVKRLINTQDMVIVRLTSDGGDLVTGLNIGEQVHAHNTDTYAVKRCASVCGLIWLAGKTRVAEADTAIGFHSAYYKVNGQVTPE